ncbi:sensor histidine kinase [Oceanobacillus manasiensis]|uniref:sensor histidine kinase n=1 Tax=Oceanobacillus manasiensis TaxID=586413 RepID=UPI0005A84D58|nr:sensor histidine kinase [Oceanobacillus manasiensis]
MIDLLITMLERVGILVAMAFVLTRFRFFQDMIHQDHLNNRKQFTAILFFGLFGIMGTYYGVALNTGTLNFNTVTMELAAEEAIANSRVIGVVIAGLLGGYRVGIGAGLIAGVHRLSMGGFTAVSCGLASVIAGGMAGYFRKKGKYLNLPTAFLIGALAETIQMLIIIVLSRPFEMAWTLVEIIGIPMILANGFGTAIFLLIVQNVVKEKENASAEQAQKTLRIAEQTVGYLRQGMTNKSALAVCNILYKEINPSAVAITDKELILAHVGLASDHHAANTPIRTQLTKEVIQHGKLVVANDETIHCSVEGCPLGAVVMAPLKSRDEVIGTLKVYFQSEKHITNVNLELISGLSSLLSTQVELADTEKAYQLAKEAEIKALQAQISPHFLFNSLNIIVSLIRTDPTKARKLLMSLSHFFRQNLAGTTAETVSLRQEIEHVKAYLAIESSRFIDKLHVTYDIDETVLEQTIPPLTLQPLVENAVKHGIKDLEKDAHVRICIKRGENKIILLIEDNGAGIDADKLQNLGKVQLKSQTGTGIGLYNVNRRLTMKFGMRAGIQLDSKPGHGTKITINLPTGNGGNKE